MSAERFDAAWLALREPADHRARVEELARMLQRWWWHQAGRSVLDLGSGTGSNLRYLHPRLGGTARWTALDHDAGLLARLADGAAGKVRTVVGGLEDEGIELVADATLVTGSALLDLVSGSWLDRLVEACASARAAALFVLTYDGSIRWVDGAGDTLDDPRDSLVRAAVNEHQMRDKGLGPALGPEGGPAVAERLAAAGYRVMTAPSPWRLGPGDLDLATALLEGWAAAAIEQRPGAASSISAWAEERTAHLEADGWGLEVGHLDVLALPPGSAEDA